MKDDAIAQLQELERKQSIILRCGNKSITIVRSISKKHGIKIQAKNAGRTSS